MDLQTLQVYQASTSTQSTQGLFGVPDSWIEAMKQLVLAQVEEESSCVMETKCLIWKGKMAKGTPSIYYRGGSYSVRRLVWLLSGQSLKPYQSLSPGCGNPKCVNPAHLIAKGRDRKSTKVINPKLITIDL